MSIRRLAAGATATALATLAAATCASAATFDLEAHRGGRGLRPENTLASFGHALQLGVRTLELDTGVTKDGTVVVSHERRISSLECQGQYVGQLIHDLTLAQIKTLDCGTRHPADPSKDEFVGTQQAVPGTRMPTLAEVFQLVDRYGADAVRFNIETKIDPTAPGDTVGPTTFTNKVVRVIKRYHMIRRTSLQSFDWRTLIAARTVAPRLRRVALVEKKSFYPGTPWSAGITIPADWLTTGSIAHVVAHDLKAQVVSPNADDTPDLTPVISASHNEGLTVIPWTVNDPAKMADLIHRGVDGLITDYPDRLRDVMATAGLDLPEPIASPFDVEAHRGGRRYRPENTLASFSYGLSLHVDTLELDTGVTADGVLVVAHDRSINPKHCLDTAPATPGDPQFPYAGKPIHALTLAQIRTLDCGSTGEFADQPGWVASPGEHMPTLQEVFDLVKASGDDHVRMNVETKISPLVNDTAPYDVFTAKLVKAIRDNDFEDRVIIQSFDWRTIRLAKRLDPQIETSALVWQYAGTGCDALADECSLEAVMGDPSVKSPWTGGLDWWDYQDLATLVRKAHADIVSSNWQVHDPTQGHVESTDDYLKEDPAIYHGPPVPELQRRGLRVIPYTIDDEPTMQRVIDLGVDGIISDDPALLILVAERNGLR